MSCPQCQGSCERCDDMCGTYTCPTDMIEFFFYNDNYVFGRVDTCKYMWNPKIEPAKSHEIEPAKSHETEPTLNDTPQNQEPPALGWVDYLFNKVASIFNSL